ncbi:hypothetical protein J8L08_14555 [Bacteroides fragilis]|jgi:hypothetical protein|uniref:hypothetical protein n=1 Tax=Bacteroides fragilis TaxID=817 RepID=UPI00202E3DEC|nr:hypothetical protein [Bacteroides fragilis]MCE8612752.1 hypothetical protein [Bacteroides fragilis]MCM0217475.1 hypothetical protein [Bacteroides fragilis]MCM0265972.1 hypothetical protein [Bacteroides fragilis]MCM0276852.1 hypothetical protein [Bacteroides fragilis]
MSNAIERHPIWSLVITFITSASFIWGLTYFFYYENKDSLHKAEKDNIESKFKSEVAGYASEISTLKQRIEILEIERDKLKETNDIYFDCLSKNPNLIPVLKHRIEEYSLLKASKTDTICIENKDQSVKYVANQVKRDTSSVRINKGNTYISKEMEVIIGLHDIDVLSKATINVSLGKNLTTQEIVTAGKSFKYTTKGENKTLVIKTVDYVRGYIDVEII